MQLISDLKNDDISKVKWAKIHLRGQSSYKPKQQKIEMVNLNPIVVRHYSFQPPRWQ